MIVGTLHEGVSHAECARILSVSPSSDDHSALEQIFRESVPDIGPRLTWRLSRASSLVPALEILKKLPHPVAICERDLFPCSWKDLLNHSRDLPHPPLIVVASRHADEGLWAEALNIGAYDVLAKPFDRSEIVRVVSLASVRWRRHADATRASNFVQPNGLRRGESG